MRTQPEKGNIHPGEGERASAFFIALAVIALLISLGVAFIGVAQSEQFGEQRHDVNDRAKMLAKSGVEKAKAKISDVLKEKSEFSTMMTLYGRTAKGHPPMRQLHVPLEKAYWVSSFGVDFSANRSRDENGNYSVRISNRGSNLTGRDDRNNDGDSRTDESDEGGGTFHDRFGYSGLLPATFSGGRDLYALKIRPTQGLIYINGPDASPFRDRVDPLARSQKQLLNNLARELNRRHEDRPEWIEIPDGSSGATPLGDLISFIRMELERNIRSMKELRRMFEDKNISGKIVDQLAPYITARAWVDRTTLDPRTLNHPDGSGSARYRRNKRGKRHLQPRAPIDINNAPEPVVTALLSGIEATTTVQTDRGKFRFSRVDISPDLAREIADRIVKRRKELMWMNGKGFRGINQLHNFIFALDAEAELDSLDTGVRPPDEFSSAGRDSEEIKAIQQAIMANFNPNTRLDSVNPNFSMGIQFGDVSKADLGDTNGAKNRVGWTTEVCFFSNYYRITSLGRVLGSPDKQASLPGDSGGSLTGDAVPRPLMAEEKIETVVKFQESYRLSTQRGFYENYLPNAEGGDLSKAMQRAFYPENLRDREEPAAYDGYLQLPMTKLSDMFDSYEPGEGDGGEDIASRLQERKKEMKKEMEERFEQAREERISELKNTLASKAVKNACKNGVDKEIDPKKDKLLDEADANKEEEVKDEEIQAKLDELDKERKEKKGTCDQITFMEDAANYVKKGEKYLKKWQDIKSKLNEDSGVGKYLDPEDVKTAAGVAAGTAAVSKLSEMTGMTDDFAREWYKEGKGEIKELKNTELLGEATGGDFVKMWKMYKDISGLKESISSFSEKSSIGQLKLARSVVLKANSLSRAVHELDFVEGEVIEQMGGDLDELAGEKSWDSLSQKKKNKLGKKYFSKGKWAEWGKNQELQIPWGDEDVKVIDAYQAWKMAGMTVDLWRMQRISENFSGKSDIQQARAVVQFTAAASSLTKKAAQAFLEEELKEQVMSQLETIGNVASIVTFTIDVVEGFKQSSKWEDMIEQAKQAEIVGLTPGQIKKRVRPIEYDEDFSPDPKQKDPVADHNRSLVGNEPSDLLPDGFFTTTENCPENLYHRNGGKLLANMVPGVAMAAPVAAGANEWEAVKNVAVGGLIKTAGLAASGASAGAAIGALGGPIGAAAGAAIGAAIGLLQTLAAISGGWSNLLKKGGMGAAIGGAIAGPLGALIGGIVGLISALGSDCDASSCCPDDSEVKNKLGSGCGEEGGICIETGQEAFGKISMWVKPRWSSGDLSRSGAREGARTLLDIGGFKKKRKAIYEGFDGRPSGFLGRFLEPDKIKYTYKFPRLQAGFIQKNGRFLALATNGKKVHSYNMPPEYESSRNPCSPYRNIRWRPPVCDTSKSYREEIVTSALELDNGDEGDSSIDPYFLAPSPSTNPSDLPDDHPYKDVRSWSQPGRWHHVTIQGKWKLNNINVHWDVSCGGGFGVEYCKGCDLDKIEFNNNEYFRIVVDGEPGEWKQTYDANQTIFMEPDGNIQDEGQDLFWNMRHSRDLNVGFTEAGYIELEPDDGEDPNKEINSPFTFRPRDRENEPYKEVQNSIEDRINFNDQTGKPYKGDMTIGSIKIRNTKANSIKPGNLYRSGFDYQGYIGPRNERQYFQADPVDFHGTVSDVQFTGYKPVRTHQNSNIVVAVQNAKQDQPIGGDTTVSPGERLVLKAFLRNELETKEVRVENEDGEMITREKPVGWRSTTPTLDSVTVQVLRDEPLMLQYNVSE